MGRSGSSAGRAGRSASAEAKPEADPSPEQAERPPPRRSGRQTTAAPPGPAGKPPPSGGKPPKPEAGKKDKAGSTGKQRAPSASPAPAKSGSTAKGGGGKGAASAATSGGGKKGAASAAPSGGKKGKAAVQSEEAEPAKEAALQEAEPAKEAAPPRREAQRKRSSFSSKKKKKEPEIDQTVYAPPPEAALPAEVVVSEGSDGSRVTIPSSDVGELLAAWNVMRAFSWQLRLSPFSFQDLCAAMASPMPTVLMDELHLCVLRALAVDETPAERAERGLDVSLLDAMTWPAYAWEMLRLTEDPLSEHEWTYRQPAAVAAKEEAASEGTPPKEDEAGPSSSSSPPPSQPRSGGASPAQQPRRVAFAPLPDLAATDAELAAGLSSERRPHSELADELRRRWAKGRPAPPPSQPDYYALPVGVKAAILSRLCDHLLDCTTIRAEIDRREREGQAVAGKGGQGGAFPILTPEQRKKAEKKAQTDANADCCVLCGQGGNLICCDGCPAAYHMRCMGLNHKSLGDGDWLCPECAVGGRGEAAGLRVPAGARGKEKQALYAMHGMLVKAGLPSVKSRGQHAEELEVTVPMVVLRGGEAEQELKKAQRVRGGDDEAHPSSFDCVKDPPLLLTGVEAEGAPSGPEGYANKYKNGWAAAVASIRTAIDEVKRSKGKRGNYIPTGTTGFLSVPELPAPLNLSKYQWLQLQGKSARTVRCGKCNSCLNPSLRKGCLNPVVRAGEEASADTSKLGFLIAYASRVEREFWQLLEGPWATLGGGGMAHKNAWLAAVRSATSVEQLAKAVLQLEAALRPVALVPDWRPVLAPAPGRTPSASRAVSRATSTADLAAAGASEARPEGGSDDERGEGEGEAEGGGAAVGAELQREPRWLADPYDLRYEKQTLRAGWVVDRRFHAAHVTGVNRLPRALLRKAARQAGWRPIPGVRYRKQKQVPLPPRLQWVADMEAAQTAAQLAYGLRQLDGVLQWDTASKPKTDSETPFFQAVLLGKRPASAPSEGEAGPVGGFEYLLQMQPPPTPAPLQQQALALALQRSAALAMGQQPMLGDGPVPMMLAGQPGAGLAAAAQKPVFLVAGTPLLAAQQQAAAGGLVFLQPVPAQQQQQQQSQGRLGGLGRPALSPALLGPSPMLGAALPPLPPGMAAVAHQRSTTPTPAMKQALQASGSTAALVKEEPAAAATDSQQGEDVVMADAGAAAEEAHAGSVSEAGPSAAPKSKGGDGPSSTLPAEPAGVATAGPAAAGGEPEQPGEAMDVDGPAEPKQEQQPSGGASPASAAPSGAPSGAAGPTPSVSVAAGTTEADDEEGGDSEDDEEEGEEGASQAAEGTLGQKRRGAKKRRCGLCKHCLNPAGKQVCLQLRALREERKARQAAEAAQRQVEEALLADDPAYLARKLTAAAFRSALAAVDEEELRSPEAPAAMAAKLRARLSNVSSSALAAGAGGSEAKGGGSAKKGALPRPPSLGKLSGAEVKAEPVVQLPGGAALPLKAALAAQSEAVWLHERHLPLWLIKAYEERVRREEANAAARMAAAAARNKQLSTGGDREAARSAARAAAAAAADACGACGAVHGEEPELDHLWICCDSCNRWFHAGCVGMGQEDVDAIGDGSPWACPGCWDNNRRLERAARRQAAQRGAQPAAPVPIPVPTASQPGGTDGEQKLEGPRRGRPPKPFWQKADYQRKEQQALDRIKRQAQREAIAAAIAAGEPIEEVQRALLPEDRLFKRRRKEEEEQRQREEEEAEAAAAAAAAAAAEKKQQRAKRKREQVEEDEEDEEEEDMEVYCPLCKLPDYGRELVECDACKTWFHPTCAGTTLEEVEAVDQWVCAACQGKRLRAPSQAAIQAAILAARERQEAEEAGGSGKGAKRAKSAGEPAEGETWADAVLRVLTKVVKLRTAEDFLTAVPREVEGYYEVIKKPMDLGKIRRRLQQGKYASPEAVLADTRLVWRNCRYFNKAGSEIVDDANATQQALERRWAEAGLPLPPEPAAEESDEEPEGEGEQQQQQLPGGAAARQRSGSVGAVEGAEGPPGEGPPAVAAAAAAGGLLEKAPGSGRVRHKSLRWAEAEEGGAAVLARQPQRPQQQRPQAPRSGGKRQPQGEPAPDWASRAGKVLERLMRLGDADPFTEPVPKEYPDYHAVIKHPMDLATVSKKLQRGRYSDPGQMAADIQLVFSNCRKFNEPAAPIVGQAAAVEAAWKKYWQGAGIYAEGGPGPASARARPEGGSKHGPFDWKGAARAVLFRVQLQKAAGWFMEPVDELEAPDYKDIVKQPMDFSFISQKLAADQYSVPQQLLDDVALIRSNCVLYNGEDSPVTRDCNITMSVFEAAWAEKGLAQYMEEVVSHQHEGTAAAAAATPAVERPSEAPATAAPAAAASAVLQQGMRSSSRVRAVGSVYAGGAPAPALAGWVGTAQEALKRVLRMPDAQVFSQPVTPKVAPDYYTIVQRPMDLGTVLRKLGAGQYASPRDVEADVRLVFENCRAYNQPGDSVGQMGEAVEAAFSKHWAAAELAGAAAGPVPAPVPGVELAGAEQRALSEPGPSAVLAGAPGDEGGVAADGGGGEGEEEPAVEAGVQQHQEQQQQPPFVGQPLHQFAAVDEAAAGAQLQQQLQGRDEVVDDDAPACTALPAAESPAAPASDQAAVLEHAGSEPAVGLEPPAASGLEAPVLVGEGLGATVATSSSAGELAAEPMEVDAPAPAAVQPGQGLQELQLQQPEPPLQQPEGMQQDQPAGQVAEPAGAGAGGLDEAAMEGAS